MNEFIVWVKEEKRIDVLISIDYEHGEITCMENQSERTYNFHEVSFLPYIGKTDINNKKIYADCSIVEFSVCSLEPFSKKKQTKRIGKVRYCNSTCAYEIVVINMSRIEYYDFSGMAFEISDIKVIDTIQENKLRLIK